jgi:hypothetical protein
MTFVDSTGKDLSRGATGKRNWVSGGLKARLLQKFGKRYGWIPETAQGGMLVRRWFLVYRVRVNLPA